jgi:hypothetical protein
MPATAEALASGEVSETAVSLLLSARDAAPEQFAEAEETLVEAGRVLSVGELKRAVDYWRQSADAKRAADDEERRFERRHLHVSPALDGMVRVDGDLDPETGQTLITALGRSKTRRLADRADPTSDRPHSAAPTRSASSAAGGSTRPVARPWPGSVRTSW